MSEPYNDEDFVALPGQIISYKKAMEIAVRKYRELKEENDKLNEKIDALETNILDKKYQIEDLHTEPIKTVLKSPQGEKYLKEAIRLLGDDEDMMRLFPNHFAKENAKLKAEIKKFTDYSSQGDR